MLAPRLIARGLGRCWPWRCGASARQSVCARSSAGCVSLLDTTKQDGLFSAACLNRCRAVKSVLRVSARTPLILLGIALAIALQILNARGLLSAYSYWSDEAFSAATALADWKSLFFSWVLPDTAPPLFPVFLKTWQSIFGYSEISSRLLSFAFSTAALIVLSLFALRSGRAAYICAVLFLGTSPIFSRYGQEVRNYSLVLLLSAVALSGLIEWCRHVRAGQSSVRSEACFRVSIIFLSLTHYFALVYCFALLSFKAFYGFLAASRRNSELVRDAVNVILIVAFPVWHLVAFRRQSSVNLLAWNDVRPFWGTLSNLGESLWPGNTIAPLVIVLLLLVALFAAPVFSSSIKAQLVVIAASSCVFVSFIIIIDLITASFSTDRNFIVILPAATLAISCLLQGMVESIEPLAPRLLILSLALFVAIQQFNVSASNMLHGKIVPYENYKQVAVSLGRSGVCKKVSCYSIGVGKWWGDVYFGPQSVSLIDLPAVHSAPADPGSIIVAAGPAGRAGLTREREGVGLEGSQCLQPRQAWNRSVLVLVPERLVSDLVKYKLSNVDCPSV